MFEDDITRGAPSSENSGQVSDQHLPLQLPFMDVESELLQRQLLLASLALPNNPMTALHSSSVTMPPTGRPSYGNSGQLPDQHLYQLLDTELQRQLLLDSLTLPNNPRASLHFPSATMPPYQSHNPLEPSSVHSSQAPRELPPPQLSPMDTNPQLLQRQFLLDSFAAPNVASLHYQALNPVEEHSAPSTYTSIPTHDTNSMIQQLRQREIANGQLQMRNMMGEGTADPRFSFLGAPTQLEGQMEDKEGPSRKRRAPADRLVEEMDRKPKEITRSSSLLLPSQSHPVFSRRPSLPTRVPLDPGMDLSQWVAGPTQYGFPQQVIPRTGPYEEKEQSALARLQEVLPSVTAPSSSRQSKIEAVGNKGLVEESNEASVSEDSIPFAVDEEQGE